MNRRFIVVEGIYAGLGDLAPLDKICELKKKYKYRCSGRHSGAGCPGHAWAGCLLQQRGADRGATGSQ